MEGIIITMQKQELEEMMMQSVQIALDSVFNKFAFETKVPNPPQNDIMTAEEVCHLLNLKRSALYQKTHRSEIPFLKKGKFLYFSRNEILEWLESGKHQSRIQNEKQYEIELSNRGNKGLISNK